MDFNFSVVVIFYEKIKIHLHYHESKAFLIFYSVQIAEDQLRRVLHSLGYQKKKQKNLAYGALFLVLWELKLF